MEKKLNINEWAVEDRPREKMMAHGAGALSDAELLAILIGSGSRDETAVELMRRVLASCHNDLGELGKMGLDELCAFKGIGEAKAITVLAASELGKRRAAAENRRERVQIRSSEDIYRYFHPLLCDVSVEECWVLLLNQSLKVIDRVDWLRRQSTYAWCFVRLCCAVRRPLRSVTIIRRATCVPARTTIV